MLRCSWRHQIFFLQQREVHQNMLEQQDFIVQIAKSHETSQPSGRIYMVQKSAEKKEETDLN